MIHKNNLIQFTRLALVLSLSLSFYSCIDSDSDSESNPVDGKPMASDDALEVIQDSGSGAENQIDVSGNDNLGTDGGTDDNYSLSEGATNGSVTEISDGTFEYIPNSGFFGEDAFTYELSDADGDTDTAVVKITVVKIEGPTAKDFENINPNHPSFVSIDDTTPEGYSWVKLEAMSDEFDAWDSSKWFHSVWNYGVPVFMSNSAENSGVTDGNLWIKASLNENNPEGRWFQTARIHSKAETSYPMYTEARIKTAHISAYNTFWLNKGEGGGGIFRDEIDVIENNSKPSCSGCSADVFPEQMNSQYFHADDNLEPKEIRNKGNFMRSDLSEANPLRNVGWNEDYHTYGVWWKDERNIQFYLDGEPAGSVVVGEDQDGTYYEERFFTRELEIIFDLWTNEATWLGGLPPKSDLQDNTINTMKIDWVRTWKLEE
ncbi:Ig-like domain-containing protein [Tamlana sp. 2_MG-2023]|uniref:Ig-like domain-containing protein n=1 Tax=unclassified Tamlana TaxID=2614803 RepID=UPI0026E18DB6|nr:MULTISPECIES: Ig-like domain-containing protein [unclassified Tamlana]MDO6759508.1 Ig-like domain-containing protein [Tamlana sp. 2_MG-2023]MDO6790353.1 Ig-like domain-containing protein [Tamlana sp. 1_MG-2023]